ncbi:MAG: AsmA family protein [Rhodocyclales bacterium]|nr:AsmA family protein [Rhodocyclales bacterium]
MDGSIVFVKTGQGEAAIRQRARLDQRHLRNVLIMVDGRSTVSELTERFGDADGMAQSLAELERDGFIEDVARTVSEAASPPSTDTPPGPIPVLSIPIMAAGPPLAEPEAAPMPGTAAAFVIGMPEYESVPPPPLAPPRNREADAAKKGAGWIAALGWHLAALIGRGDDSRKKKRRRRGPQVASIKPIRLGRRAYVHWSVLASLGTAGLALLLLLAAWLFPYERYRPEIERWAAAAFNDRVAVGGIGFSLLPRPNITLRDVRVGQLPYLTAAALRVTPDFFSLSGKNPVIRGIELDTVSVKGPGLARLAQMGAGRADAGMELRRVTLKALRVELGEAVFEEVGGEAELAPGGALKRIRLHNADSSLKLDVAPKGSGYRLAILGSKWVMPFSPGLTIDHLEAEGELGASRLELSKIDGKAYGGLIEGKGWVDWSGGAVLAGQVDLQRLDMAKLLPELNPRLAGEGELSARLRLEGRAEAVGGLGEALRADAGFTLRRGALKGFDLVEAVRVAGRVPTRGGATRFEEFSGNLRLDRQAYRLSELRLNSGPLRAGGHVDIGKDERLNGVMDVELRGSAALVRVPVAVSGTIRDPLLRGKR